MSELWSELTTAAKLRKKLETELLPSGSDSELPVLNHGRPTSVRHCDRWISAAQCNVRNCSRQPWHVHRSMDHGPWTWKRMEMLESLNPSMTGSDIDMAWWHEGIHNSEYKSLVQSNQIIEYSSLHSLAYSRSLLQSSVILGSGITILEVEAPLRFLGKRLAQTQTKTRSIQHTACHITCPQLSYSVSLLPDGRVPCRNGPID